jgi:hypothetical protein
MSNEIPKIPNLSELFLPRRPDFRFVCELPDHLGKVTSMECVNGRVVCKTESGIDFLVPADAEKA